jgi:hypothetical protein
MKPAHTRHIVLVDKDSSRKSRRCNNGRPSEVGAYAQGYMYCNVVYCAMTSAGTILVLTFIHLPGNRDAGGINIKSTMYSVAFLVLFFLLPL